MQKRIAALVAAFLIVLGGCSSDDDGNTTKITDQATAKAALDRVLEPMAQTLAGALKDLRGKSSPLKQGLTVGSKRSAVKVMGTASCPEGGSIAIDADAVGGVFTGSVTLTDCGLLGVKLSGKLTGTLELSGGGSGVRVDVSGTLTFSGLYSGPLTIKRLVAELGSGNFCYQAEIEIAGASLTVGDGCGGTPDMGVDGDAGPAGDSTVDSSGVDGDVGVPDTSPDADSGGGDSTADTGAGCQPGNVIDLYEQNWLTPPINLAKLVNQSTGTNSTFGSTVPGGGGNPGRFSRVNVSLLTGPQAEIWVEVPTPGASYILSALGAVHSLSLSMDISDLNTGGPTQQRFMLKQNGVLYWTPPVQAGTGWTTVNWTSADFTRASATGPAKPDFSTNGAQLRFGYFVGLASSGAVTSLISRGSGTDNWRVKITQCAP